MKKLPTITDLRALSPRELERKRAYLEAERDAWLRHADILEAKITGYRRILAEANHEIMALNDCIHWTWECQDNRTGER